MKQMKNFKVDISKIVLVLFCIGFHILGALGLMQIFNWDFVLSLAIFVLATSLLLLIIVIIDTRRS